MPGRRGDVGRDMMKVYSKTKEQGYTKQESTVELDSATENIYPFLAIRLTKKTPMALLWSYAFAVL
jgi:hypothetical protein